MDLMIKGRRAIVAGGSAGMGRATALALAEEGVELVISARGKERLDATARAIVDQTGASVTPIVADHSTPEGRASLLRAMPDPDILVITVSPPPVTHSFRDIGVADWEHSVGMGFIGPIELMRQTVDGMVERRWGRIVNIATVAAKYPIELRLASGPARAALVNYTSVLARKVAPDNVMVNNLLPGMFLTDKMHTRLDEIAQESGISEEQAVEAFCKQWRIPARRIGDPQDLGKMAAFLCSEYAKFTVGQNIVVDGGMAPGMF